MQNLTKAIGALVALLGAQACHSLSPRQSISVANSCLSFSHGPDASVIVLGTYEGDRTLDSGLPGSTAANGAAHPLLRLVKVHGKATEPDVVLVLTSYDPLIWDLSDIPQSRIRAVIVQGYAKSQVRGLAPATPLRISSGMSQPPGCGESLYAYQVGPDLDKLVSQVTKLSALKVSKFIGGYTHRDFDIDVSSEVAIAQTLANKGYASKQAPRHFPADWPGEAYVQSLVSQGTIRAATQADVDQWNAAATKRLATGALGPFVSDLLHVDDSYVVLKPLTLPGTMSGAATRVFIVPAGVPKPQLANQEAANNSLYTIDDGRCSGPMGDEC